MNASHTTTTSTSTAVRKVLRDYLDRKLNKNNVLISFKKFRREAGAAGNAITKPEFAKLLRICGLELSDAAVAEQFARVDMNGDGYITYNEFCARLFDPEHEVIARPEPRLKPGLRAAAKNRNTALLPELSPSAMRSRRDEDTRKAAGALDLLGVARALRTQVLDHGGRSNNLLASCAASAVAALHDGLGSGDEHDDDDDDDGGVRLTVTTDQLKAALHRAHDVQFLGAVTGGVLRELEAAVAREGSAGRRRGRRGGRRRRQGSDGTVDLLDLVHYLYAVSYTHLTLPTIYSV